MQELERVLWHELGTQQEYAETTSIGNLAAFVRSLVGLSQEAVNEKFGGYLNGNLLNSQQQEFVWTIISYGKTGGVDANACTEIMELVRCGKLDTSCLITHRAPLNDILEGYRIFENKADGCIKWVVTPFER